MLFTDIEGSTRLFQRLGSAYPAALAQHHRLMRCAIAEANGYEVKTEGDSFFVVFGDATDAVRAAVSAQRALSAEVALSAAAWPDAAARPDAARLSVRMGLHTGEVELMDGQYVGMEIHRASRIAATAHGGQVVLSEATRVAAQAELPPGVAISDLGQHRLRDFDETERIHQLDIEGLRTEFPPLASVSARFALLPPELSTFVGRGQQVSQAADLLRSSRLLTMTGPGGTGKTRLALQLARHCAESYRHGVAFVPLAAISDPGLVLATIRGTLGFAEEPGRSSLDTLRDKLHRQEVLLILDNFEQVMPASRSIESLLAGTEAVTVVVTSRAALHLEGEQEFAVPPLGLPRVGRTVDPDVIGRSEAVALFVERARRVRPDFSLEATNARSVALICERLDGLPLAIELAASRIKLLAPEQLLARLSRRLEILAPGGVEPSDRRRTLRGTIDWSHDLLDLSERALFRRLAIFTGGATLEAVETVASRVRDGDEQAIPDVLVPLASLVDHSLVGQATKGGASRYSMLETIREYGQERLAEAGELEPLAEAHARWFLARMVALAPGFTAGPEALDEVESDHDNVRAALRWAIDHSQTELALISVAALWRFWHLRGHLREGLHACDDVLDLPGAEAPTEAGARALHARASLLYWQGDPGAAHDVYLRSLDAARGSGSMIAEAEAQFALGFSYAASGDWEHAHQAARAAGDLYDALGDRLGRANARYSDAFFSSTAGEWEVAAVGFEAVLPEFEALGNPFWLMSHRVSYAWTLQRLGRSDEARRLHLLNLEGSVELGDRSMEHMALQGLASMAAQAGDVERALRLVGAAEAIAEDLGGKAPSELVMALDPVTQVRELGISEQTISRLVEEGRGMTPESTRDLARGA